jgi:hypothetical protein
MRRTSALDAHFRLRADFENPLPFSLPSAIVFFDGG